MKLQKRGAWLYRNHQLIRPVRGPHAGKWAAHRLYGQPISECGYSRTRDEAAKKLDEYLEKIPS